MHDSGVLIFRHKYKKTGIYFGSIQCCNIIGCFDQPIKLCVKRRVSEDISIAPFSVEYGAPAVISWDIQERLDVKFLLIMNNLLVLNSSNQESPTAPVEVVTKITEVLLDYQTGNFTSESMYMCRSDRSTHAHVQSGQKNPCTCA